MDVKYLRSVVKYIITALVSVLIVFYLIYQARAASGEFPATTILKIRTANINIPLDGYIFLNETVIPCSQDDKIVLPECSEGTVVYPGKLLASLYEKSYSDTVEEIRKIDDKIYLLSESSSVKGGSLDTSNYEKAVSKALSSLLESSENGNLSLSSYSAREWFVAKSRRNISVNFTQGYASIINSLSLEREALKSSAGTPTKIYSSLSGKYYSVTDGYEEYFDYSLPGSDYSSLSAFFDGIPQLSQSSSQNTGKIISIGKWYYVCRGNNLSDSFTVGKSYPITFSGNGETTVAMTYEKSLSGYDGDDEFLVFSATDLPDGFSLSRRKIASANTGSREGLFVPESAVRYKDGCVGVYVVDGNKARFRRISVIAVIDGVYIVNPNVTAENGETEYLRLYDTLITSDKDIYDGKYIGVSS